jgi:surface antigen
MRTTFRLLACSFAPVFLSLAFAPAAMADNDHGKGHGHNKHKEEYWDGNCKVERKWEKDGDYKEKRKCQGPEYHEPRTVVIQQPVYVQPPVVVQQPVVVQRPATVVYPPWVVVEAGRPHHYRSGYEPVAPLQIQAQAPVSHCNSETVGQVLGGVAGALLGNQVGKGTGRAVATVGGAVAGVLVGGEVGRRMDAKDQGCVGQTLELAPAGRRVEWADGGQQYVVVPGTVVHRGGRYCRPYEAQVRVGSGWQTTRGTACRRNDGVWVTV